MGSDTQVTCMECNQQFKSDNGLHKHLKAHNMTMGEYYTTHYPRKNKWTQELLPFKNKEDYFNNDFSTRGQMLKWCDKAPKAEVKEYILKQLENRIERKQLKYAPNHLEIELNKLPPIKLYQKMFGSYFAACEMLNIRPLFSQPMLKAFPQEEEYLEDIEIFVDTREQKPLSFKKSSGLKLDFGDYTMGGEHYNYTYVDRKSESDFKGTLGGGKSRFERELKRARRFNAFLYVVVESSISNIKKNNNFGSYKSNLPYIWHNMREFTHKYKGSCQFIFTGGRINSARLIPKLLYHGPKLWNVDLQYYLDNHDMD
tara:strand:- start:280 stop:1218 length:939 start_codon:yes stop_codon:yes gene_type:complete